jgi:hypothetical protein
MDAYAMQHPFALLMLLQDLGVIARATVMVGSAVAVAYPISQYISTKDDTQTKTTTACPDLPRPPVEGTYYRGLSRDDLWEFSMFGIVQSKFVREGLGGFVEALEWFVAGATRHPGGSDVINWDEVMKGKPMIPSPFVSTSLSLGKAREFAEDGPTPGHVVIRFTTTRRGIGPIMGMGESEVLFFVLLGEPGETLEVVP